MAPMVLTDRLFQDHPSTVMTEPTCRVLLGHTQPPRSFDPSLRSHPFLMTIASVIMIHFPRVLIPPHRPLRVEQSIETIHIHRIRTIFATTARTAIMSHREATPGKSHSSSPIAQRCIVDLRKVDQELLENLLSRGRETLSLWKVDISSRESTKSTD
jgi:hypothetical protein